jgi:hypothetical protein
MAAAWASGHPDGRLGAGLPVQEHGAFAAGHGVHELGELVRECVVVDRWVDEDVGEVVAVGVLDEDGPVASVWSAGVSGSCSSSIERSSSRSPSSSQ